MPVGPSILWLEKTYKVTVQRGHIERQVRRRLSPVDDRHRPGRARPPAISATGLIVPSTFDTWAKATTRVRAPEHPLEGLEVELPVAGERDRTALSRAAVPGGHLPRDDVRVVLHLGDEDLVPRPERPAQRLGHQAEPVGRPAREDDLLAAGARR